MARLGIGGIGFKTLADAFLDAMPRIEGFVRARHRGHHDLDRLVIDVQELAWRYAKRKWRRGKEVRLDFGLLCKMSLADRGISNLSGRKRLKVTNDSRLLHKILAAEQRQDLLVDFAEAMTKLSFLHREILRLRIANFSWSEVCKMLKTNVFHIHRAYEELRWHLRDYR